MSYKVYATAAPARDPKKRLWCEVCGRDLPLDCRASTRRCRDCLNSKIFKEDKK